MIHNYSPAFSGLAGARGSAGAAGCATCLVNGDFDGLWIPQGKSLLRNSRTIDTHRDHFEVRCGVSGCMKWLI